MDKLRNITFVLIKFGLCQPVIEATRLSNNVRGLQTELVIPVTVTFT